MLSGRAECALSAFSHKACCQVQMLVSVLVSDLQMSAVHYSAFELLYTCGSRIRTIGDCYPAFGSAASMFSVQQKQVFR